MREPSKLGGAVAPCRADDQAQQLASCLHRVPQEGVQGTRSTFTGLATTTLQGSAGKSSAPRPAEMRSGGQLSRACSTMPLGHSITCIHTKALLDVLLPLLDISPLSASNWPAS